ncbi:hypothetical protein [Aliiglaciecola lipolytica]|uniref:hypothetical protein n=1 Tax=Aliiglaciecola lipolytica TaxID=477689 RepID=UPI001C08E302|nr:hypothetical protein [Aliiglaciecola lipolytica]MBU2877591.1 hypothetical protein [Aliiglaciecola lipolytica]
MPRHITKTGNTRDYRLNAKRCAEMLAIMEPILEKAVYNLDSWQECFEARVRRSEHAYRVVKANLDKNPKHYLEAAHKKALSCIYDKYL